MVNKPKPRPCPFCGCRPKIFAPGWGVYGNYVQCVAKRCALNPMTNSYPTREKAIAAWNRRNGEEERQ